MRCNRASCLKNYFAFLKLLIFVGVFNVFATSNLHANDLNIESLGEIKQLSGQLLINPFERIRAALKAVNERVNQLEQAVDEQLMSTLPVDINVDCAAGETVSPVIAQYANAYAALTINVSGVCTENVIIFRDNVTINGVTEDAAINSATGALGGITLSRGASHIEINDLSTAGGLGLFVTRNAQAVIKNVTVTNTENGFVAVDGANIYIDNSHSQNNGIGAVSTKNAIIVMANTLLGQNTVGAFANNGGIIDLTSQDSDGNTVPGPVISNNNTGIVGQTGARLSMRDSRIEFNTGLGIYIHTQASLHFQSSANGPANIIDNNNIGIYALKNTSMLFNRANHTFSNNQIAIFCADPNVSYFINTPTDTEPGVFINNNVNVLNCVDQ